MISSSINLGRTRTDADAHRRTVLGRSRRRGLGEVPQSGWRKREHQTSRRRAATPTRPAMELSLSARVLASRRRGSLRLGRPCALCAGVRSLSSRLRQCEQVPRCRVVQAVCCGCADDLGSRTKVQGRIHLAPEMRADRRATPRFGSGVLMRGGQAIAFPSSLPHRNAGADESAPNNAIEPQIYAQSCSIRPVMPSSLDDSAIPRNRHTAERQDRRGGRIV